MDYYPIVSTQVILAVAQPDPPDPANATFTDSPPIDPGFATALQVHVAAPESLPTIVTVGVPTNTILAVVVPFFAAPETVQPAVSPVESLATTVAVKAIEQLLPGMKWLVVLTVRLSVVKTMGDVPLSCARKTEIRN